MCTVDCPLDTLGRGHPLGGRDTGGVDRAIFREENGSFGVKLLRVGVSARALGRGPGGAATLGGRSKTSFREERSLSCGLMC